jgi:hypothetical protein
MFRAHKEMTEIQVKIAELGGAGDLVYLGFSGALRSAVA